MEHLEMAVSSTFHFRINGGDEMTISIPSGIYMVGVAAALAYATEQEARAEEIDIEIWVPKLVPDYGPYKYRAVINVYGNLEIMPDLRKEPTPG